MIHPSLILSKEMIFSSGSALLAHINMVGINATVVFEREMRKIQVSVHYMVTMVKYAVNK
ncbi:hypothetical protein M413DRAFT_251460 [Hebeloma cylindrosporum]|uniref:Uncharacterized protein n=1 Tax=Hebeloma cylindrosporum TaxID=76867 RepID=A0A0C2Y9Z9_HEBCY|nr:hypothetical protein M413DRAFT_251460 [Hebeloma cylindrosporum h7]